MRRTLAVDLGNSYIKAGVFDGDQLLADWRWGYDSYEELGSVIYSYQVTHSIISSVVEEKGAEIESLLKESTESLILDKNTKLPFLNAYVTADTLGVDRLALVAAAYNKFPNNNNLVISVGTAITYNVILSNRAFRGGNITPGLQMRMHALHTFTDQLPLVGIKGDTTVLGYDTESSIRSGVVNGAAYEIDGFINAYKEQLGDINVFLTGGDAVILGSKLKNTTFVDLNLQLKGLNSILHYNAK
jgi:type III pantothenate kinase